MDDPNATGHHERPQSFKRSSELQRFPVSFCCVHFFLFSILSRQYLLSLAMIEHQTNTGCKMVYFQDSRISIENCKSMPH
jgi:hypothetical protein